MKKLFFLLIVFFLSCGPDPIPDPAVPNLIAPINLNSCTSATKINEVQQQVLFEWTTSLHTDSYELVIQNAITGNQQTKNTSLLKEMVILNQGAPYKWHVVSKSLATIVRGKSVEWQFYLEGNPESSHLPFPAVLIQPEDKSIVSLNISGEFVFQWSGADLDNDISSYNLYLGRGISELDIVKQLVNSNQYSQVLTPNTSYFWQVETIDNEGNRSFSSIFQFDTE
jgi:hypothetical protein